MAVVCFFIASVSSATKSTEIPAASCSNDLTVKLKMNDYVLEIEIIFQSGERYCVIEYNMI